MTVAAEHFGTNMRATVATTVPNFSRGSVIPVTMLFAYLKPELAAHFGEPQGLLYSGLALGWLVTLLAGLGSPWPAGDVPRRSRFSRDVRTEHAASRHRRKGLRRLPSMEVKIR